MLDRLGMLGKLGYVRQVRLCQAGQVMLGRLCQVRLCQAGVALAIVSNPSPHAMAGTAVAPLPAPCWRCLEALRCPSLGYNTQTHSVYVVYTRTRIYTHIHTPIHTITFCLCGVYAQRHAHMYTHMHIYMGHTHTYTHIHTHTHTYTYIYITRPSYGWPAMVYVKYSVLIRHN